MPAQRAIWRPGMQRNERGLSFMAHNGEFIDFMLQAGVLRFGDFTTKSGRKTPFFINTGLYKTGGQIEKLGGFYAQAVREKAPEATVLFGPAYKGIPLAVAAATAMAKWKDIGFCFNRKEQKDHGEGGLLVGQVPAAGDSVVIVEDVITSGASLRETVPLLQALPGVKIACALVSVDRREKGPAGISAIEQITKEFGFPVYALTDIREVASHLYAAGKLAPEIVLAIARYMDEYGVEGGGFFRKLL